MLNVTPSTTAMRANDRLDVGRLRRSYSIFVGLETPYPIHCAGNTRSHDVDKGCAEDLNSPPRFYRVGHNCELDATHDENECSGRAVSGVLGVNAGLC